MAMGMNHFSFPREKFNQMESAMNIFEHVGMFDYLLPLSFPVHLVARRNIMMIGSRTEGDTMHLCNGCAASRAWCGPSQRAWIRRYSGPVPQCRPAPVEQRAHTTLTLVRQQIRDAGSSRVATSSIRVVHNHASVISELLHAQRWCCAGLGCSSTLRH